MDQQIIAVYRRIAREHRASVDDILIVSTLRTEFVAECRSAVGHDIDEEATLRRLCNLRKRSKLLRTEELVPTAAETCS